MEGITHTPAYPHLFKTLTVDDITLKNRCVMGSMHTGLEEAKHGFGRLAAFYRQRAEGGVALIVTGGVAPNRVGRLAPFALKLTNIREMKRHRIVTDAVHEVDSKIALQILHAGRYGYHPLAAAPSRIKSPISPFTPHKLSHRQVLKTIHHFVRCAKLAQMAGYDGIEIMGSEGYLINQFLAKHTNQRHDQWGGAFINRMQFAVDIVRAVRDALGQPFIIIFRLSMLDLISDGSDWEEVVMLAKALEAAGVSIINTGIGWHEARTPTIATLVPRAAFCSVTQQIKPHVTVPLITSNRINTPEVAEAILADGVADMVSMARPFLADSHFVAKAFQGRSDAINTCIACNQACLDHVFQHKIASCLVNPQACHETELVLLPSKQPKQIAVIGAGPAGCAFAIAAGQRGHQVTLFEQSAEIGGQFNLAKRIPGKAEFNETLRYFRYQIAQQHVDLRLNSCPQPEDLSGFDKIVIATGIVPRQPKIPGIGHAKVVSYIDVLTGKRSVGPQVAIIGAGGIGFDVATYLCHHPQDDFYQHWGIDLSLQHRGGVKAPRPYPSPHRIDLLQRKAERMGKHLGKTTGWIHRQFLKHKQVNFYSGVQYQKIDDQGLHIVESNKPSVIAADTIIICAGQVSNRWLVEQLPKAKVQLIGGAYAARELDAKAAIDQATRLAAKI